MPIGRKAPPTPVCLGMEASDAVNGRRAIGRYVRELTLALLEITSPGELDLRLLLFGLNCRRRAAPFLSAIQKAGPTRVRALPFPGKVLHTLWNRSSFLPVERLLGPLDVFHAPGYLTPPSRERTRTILTLHGMATFVRPELLAHRYVTEFRKHWDVYLRRADWLISVSETSRREFLERFEFPPERILAIPLGVSREFRPLLPDMVDEELHRRFGHLGLRKPYILYVGGLQRIKNVGGLLAAYSRLMERSRVPHQLVLAGESADAGRDPGQALSNLPTAGQVITTGHLDQDGSDLPVLYNGADLLVQPSFYEGWASPPLEAMACGTPVVASTAKSLLESCGGAALHADPDDLEALADAMEKVLTDEALRGRLRESGLAWSSRWSWERTARATLNLYHEAALLGPRHADTPRQK